jgi:hypothetical protein
LPDAAAIALRKESRNDERGLHPRRKRRNGRGGRAAGSPYLAASEFGDRVGTGLEALTNAMTESRTAYDAAQRIEDAGERRRAVAVASRDMRYFADRLRTAHGVRICNQKDVFDANLAG